MTHAQAMAARRFLAAAVLSLLFAELDPNSAILNFVVATTEALMPGRALAIQYMVGQVRCPYALENAGKQ